MSDRKACREATWQHPGWNEVVAKTGLLVKNMRTGILQFL